MIICHHVLEERDIVRRSLDAQDNAELVVELDRAITHPVFDAYALDPSGEIGADIDGRGGRKLVTEEGRDVFGAYGVDGGANQRLVDAGQRGAIAKQDVGGVLHLHDTPVVANAERAQDRAKALGEAIERTVQVLDAPLIGQGLCLFELSDVDKGIVELLESDCALAELDRQPVVAVAGCSYLDDATAAALNDDYDEILAMLTSMATHPEQWTLR